MPRFRRYRQGGAKKIHPVKWCAPAAGDLDFTAGATQVDEVLCSEAEFETMTQPTIMRIRGSLVVGHDGANPPGDESHTLLMGIIVYPAASGAPDLATQDGLEDPWLWLHSQVYGNQAQAQILFNSSGVLVSTSTIFTKYNRELLIDVKARRKVPKGYDLRLVCKARDAQGSADAIVRGLIRTLVQE